MSRSIMACPTKSALHLNQALFVVSSFHGTAFSLFDCLLVGRVHYKRCELLILSCLRRFQSHELSTYDRHLQQLLHWIYRCVYTTIQRKNLGRTITSNSLHERAPNSSLFYLFTCPLIVLFLSHSGVLGDSNTQCYNATAKSAGLSTGGAVGSTCTTGTDCMYGICSKKKCAAPALSCPTVAAGTCCTVLYFIHSCSLCTLFTSGHNGIDPYLTCL